MNITKTTCCKAGSCSFCKPATCRQSVVFEITTGTFSVRICNKCLAKLPHTNQREAVRPMPSIVEIAQEYSKHLFSWEPDNCLPHGWMRKTLGGKVVAKVTRFVSDWCDPYHPPFIGLWATSGNEHIATSRDTDSFHEAAILASMAKGKETVDKQLIEYGYTL